MTESLFRKALWAYVALTLMGAVALFFPDYSQDLQLAFENEPDSLLMSHAWIWGPLLIVFMIGSIAGLVGLFLFKIWARPVSVICTLAGYLVSAFSGPALYTGLGDALMSASTVLWGAILALSYFSTVKDQFGR